MNPRPHEKSTELFASFARSFGVDVNDFDYDKWSAAMTMAKALDTLVDEEHIFDTEPYVTRVLEGGTISYLTKEEAAFVRTTYNDLSDLSKEQWQNAAAKLGGFAVRRAAAENIHDYLEIVIEESPLTADTLQAENDEDRTDYLQRATYNDWVYKMMRTMYVVDTAVDFIQDHNEENMNVDLTPRAVAAVARYALKETVSLVSETPAPVYAAIARRTATKTLEKVRKPGFWSTQFMWKRATR